MMRDGIFPDMHRLTSGSRRGGCPGREGFAMAAALLLTVLAAGCAGLSSTPPPSQGTAAAKPSRQLMVKLKNARASCDAERIAALARATSQQLEYLRPMSGNACVVRQHANSGKELADGFRRLVQHPSIDWLEVDGTMTTF